MENESLISLSRIIILLALFVQSNFKRFIKCQFERLKEKVFSRVDYYTPLYEKGKKEIENKSMETT